MTWVPASFSIQILEDGGSRSAETASSEYGLIKWSIFLYNAHDTFVWYIILHSIHCRSLERGLGYKFVMIKQKNIQILSIYTQIYSQIAGYDII